MSDRKEKFEKVKEKIKEYFEDGDCGLYNVRNLAGDPMTTIYDDKYFTVDICYYYSYFEVFGTTPEEFEKLNKFYEELEEEGMKDE